jgi:hypothetical protein
MHTRSASCFWLLALVWATTLCAEPVAGLRDAAARIDYGWFTADLALIHAARDSLEAGSGDPWSHYLRAYASYRAARLALADDRAATADLERCAADAAAAAAGGAPAGEASVLVAACAALAATAEPLRAVWHQRRLRQALEEALARAAGNPRLLLVRALHVHDIALPADAIVAAFRDARVPGGFPDWGEAEALLLLSAQRLAAGELRGARDALEETLLIAPDYTAALELKSRIAALTAAD